MTSVIYERQKSLLNKSNTLEPLLEAPHQHLTLPGLLAYAEQMPPLVLTLLPLAIVNFLEDNTTEPKR